MEKFLEVLLSNPEALMPMIRGYIDRYKPMVYELVQEVEAVYKDYSNNAEHPAIVARTKKNMFDAYVNVGFSEEQALALMINDNIQLIKNMKQISSLTGNKSISIK